MTWGAPPKDTRFRPLWPILPPSVAGLTVKRLLFVLCTLEAQVFGGTTAELEYRLEAARSAIYSADNGRLIPQTGVGRDGE